MILAAGLLVCGAMAVQLPAQRALELPPAPYSYAGVQLPEHFPSGRADNTPGNNPITDHGATLGRVLFYDPGLSSTGKISCASCHRQEKAFADPRRVSRGVKSRRGTRNAQGLTNARYHPTGRFFWDERADSLEDQVLMPIEHPKEMDNTMDQVVLYLDSNPAYHQLFGNAFGDPEITTERVSLALAQFVRALVSYRSKFDEGMAQVDSIHLDFPNFTEQENEGKSIFLG